MLINYDIALEKLKADSADKKVLELLSAIKGFQIDDLTNLSAKQLLVVANRLEITEASVRMALSRQTKQGKLIRESGRYTLASLKQPFRLPRFWLDIRHRSISWKGDWFLLNLGEHKFSPTIMRRLSRKAELLGLAHLPSIGWVRPNNLTDLNSEVVFHFEKVTGQSDFIMGTLSDLSVTRQDKFMKAWPTAKLNTFYQEALTFITDEQHKIKEMKDQDILVRSFAIGRFLVEYLSNDPWLPSQMVNVADREQLVNASMAYYQEIMPAWLSVLQE
ncbi:hypothetical protein [Aliiglaciecola litoralis]|uniref:PaaX-like C-terminal domain-containing protein n=1 Tax=Aliiglaciecola litoralis TaxID=582857 RepID=A0ABP3WQ60_9ALTE